VKPKLRETEESRKNNCSFSLL